MSNLIEKLKEVKLGNGRLSNRDTLYLKQYIVRDVPQCVDAFRDIKIVFLVESPHRKEIRDGHPLAGSSGLNVTKNLIFSPILHDTLITRKLNDNDRRTSIGRLVKGNKIPCLSIMNVSLLPLHKRAYDSTEGSSNKMRTLWCALEEIKGKLEKSDERELDLCPTSRDVYDVIVNDLACRIEKIARRQPKFIPFGNIARRSLDRVKQGRESSEELRVSEVPVWHPATWSRKTYEDRCIDLLCLAFGIKDYLSRTS